MTQLPSITQFEMDLVQPEYYRHLHRHALADTPQHLEDFIAGWHAGAASALIRSAQIGKALPTMAQFIELLRGARRG